MNTTTKAAIVAAVPAVAAILPGGVALAEQKTPFDWRFTRWYTGLDSRTWDPDRNVTTYLSVNSCSMSPWASHHITLQLTRESPPWYHDINYGRPVFPCGRKTQWARYTPDADYHFTLYRINGAEYPYWASANGRVGW